MPPPALRSVPAGPTAAKPTGEPYGFAPLYERELVTSCCCRPAVFARVGALLDPKLLAQAPAALAMRAALAIGEDGGRGPSSLGVVVQRLARWRDEGGPSQVTQAQIDSVLALFDGVMDAGLPDVEAVVTEAAAILKQRAKQSVVEKAMSTYATRGDFGVIAKAAAGVERIGAAEQVPGSLLGMVSFDEIGAVRLVTRLPSLCPELDNATGGGFPRGLTVFIGRSKAGKSLVLADLAAAAVSQGLFVAFATLELMREVQQARIIASLTGVPTDDILAGNDALARARLAELGPSLGRMAVQYFSPTTTSVDDLHAWIDQLEEIAGRSIDLLALDYVTKLGAGKGSGKKGDERGSGSRYEELERIGDRLRDRAYDRRYVVITAAQAKRAEKGKAKKLDGDDVQDSIHITRSADLVIAMRIDGDEEGGKDSIDYFVTDGRLMRDRIGTGSLPVDRTTCRMFPRNYEGGA